MARSTGTPELSTGSLKRMLGNDYVDSSILQLMDFWRKDVLGTLQYELLLNDGETECTAKLDVLLNNMIEEKQLEKSTIFQLQKYTCTEDSRGTKVLMLHEIELLSSGSSLPIGTSNSRSSLDILHAGNYLISPDKPSTSSNFDAIPNDRHKWSDQANQGVDVIPIMDLDPYYEKWTIIARVLYKSPIKAAMDWKGRFFFLSLLDQTAEIRAVAFENETDLQGLHDKLEIQKVYYFSRAKVEPVSKEYNLLKHPFELIFNYNTLIVKAEDSGNIPEMPEFNFQPIEKIEALQEDTFVDVIGMCRNVSGLETIKKNDGSEPDTRDLELIDKDNGQITLTLWREDAYEFNLQSNTVIVARNAKVSIFPSGTYFNFVGASMLFVNPKIPEANQLHRLFRNSGDSHTGPDFP